MLPAPISALIPVMWDAGRSVLSDCSRHFRGPQGALVSILWYLLVAVARHVKAGTLGLNVKSFT